MNREDILKMSREENRSGDEREEKIKLRSYAISATVGGLICMILLFLEDVIFDRSSTVIWIIYSGILFTKFTIDAIKLKKPIDIVLSVLLGLCCLTNTAIYVLNNIG